MEAAIEGMVVRTMVPLAVSRQWQNWRSVFDTVLFAAARKVSMVAMSGVEISLTSSRLIPAKFGVNSDLTGYCLFGPAVC